MTTKAKVPMVCLECGHKFKKALGPHTVYVGCPKCGGCDTDVDYDAPVGNKKLPCNLGALGYHFW